MVHREILPRLRKLLLGGLLRTIAIVLLSWPASVLPASGAAIGADAVVLVNSTSAKYSDFSHLLQPYLDNFGVPYTVVDISTNVPNTNFATFALVIIGHKQLDTNHLYLGSLAQASLVSAVSNGVGLVNCDNDLSTGTVPRYQFAQDIFGFSYSAPVAGANVVFPATEPASQMHYITALHQSNQTVSLRANMSLAGISVPTNMTSVLLSSGHPLLTVAKCGLGRAVQWASYDWIPVSVLGPLEGLDDTLWRSLVWAARKPFVMRGLPNFVTMRVDDCEGPFWWVHMAIDAGFKPFVPFFLNNISEANAADLRSMVTNGNATTSIHSFTASTMFYFNHQTETSYSDSVISNNYYIGTQWHINHGIPISKVIATHYSEVGPNAFAGMLQWGVEFVPIEVVPGTIEYGANPAPWLVAGPYRNYETPQQGQSVLPLYYADFLTVPGHPELNGKFFNCYTEIRDAGACGEWCPDNTVATTISRGTDILKRSLDSLVLPTLFTHEWYIHPTSCCGSTTISSNNWQAILSGITNNLATYKPVFVTLDYGNQYVRATRTSRITSSQFDTSSGAVNVSLSGYADLGTSVDVFVGADNSISNYVGTVAAFSNSTTVTAAIVSMPPAIIVPPASCTNDATTTASFGVIADGSLPLEYRWYRNGTNLLSDNARVIGSAASTLAISNVLGADVAFYTVVVSNPLGIATSSPPAHLTVLDPVITTQPASRTSHAGTLAEFLVGAKGTDLSFQWWKDATVLYQATNSTVTFPSVSTSDAASYRAVVSNSYGAVTSAVANLSVAAPLIINSLYISNGMAFVSWNAIPGSNYNLQSKGDLAETTWDHAGTIFQAAGPILTATNSALGTTQQFYRVFLVP